MSFEEYQKLGTEQDWKCAICKEYRDRLCVDHNHLTGKIRGLLCKDCNQGIGFLRDNIKLLENSIKYLER